MSTIQEVINLIREQLDDKIEAGDRKTYSDQRILTKGINAIGRDIAAIGKDKETSSTISMVSGTRAYAYPTNYWYPVSARYQDVANDDSHPVTILRSPNVTELDTLDPDNTGDPIYLYIRDNKINVWPVPDNTGLITLVMIKQFVKVTTADLSENFSAYFDDNYEDWIIDYATFNVLKYNDPLAASMRKVFYERGGAWDNIKRLEDKKFTPFNARTRRTDGVKNTGMFNDYNKSAYLFR